MGCHVEVVPAARRAGGEGQVSDRPNSSPCLPAVLLFLPPSASGRAAKPFAPTTDFWGLLIPVPPSVGTGTHHACLRTLDCAHLCGPCVTCTHAGAPSASEPVLILKPLRHSLRTHAGASQRERHRQRGGQPAQRAEPATARAMRQLRQVPARRHHGAAL
eukprot:364508-Chlamydomonas_euryale.AAC.17